jgi:hypothetical protein
MQFISFALILRVIRQNFPFSTVRSNTLKFEKSDYRGDENWQTAFETWRHMRRNKISSFARNGRVHLNRPGGVSSVDYWQPRCAASAVVMLATPCSEVVWRVLANHSIRQFPPSLPQPLRHRLPSYFKLDSTAVLWFPPRMFNGRFGRICVRGKAIEWQARTGP